jgi:hypothetical protein
MPETGRGNRFSSSPEGGLSLGIIGCDYATGPAVEAGHPLVKNNVNLSGSFDEGRLWAFSQRAGVPDRFLHS